MRKAAAHAGRLGRPTGLGLRPLLKPAGVRCFLSGSGFAAHDVAPLPARLKARPGRPALDRHVDIGRIDVEAAEAPPGPLCCNERGARSEEEIEHEVAAPRHVLDRVGDQPVGLTVGCRARSSRRLPAIELTDA